MRKLLRAIASVPPRDHDGAHERGEEQHRHDLERHEVVAEDARGDGARAADHDELVVELDLLAAVRVDEERGDHAEQEQR